MHHPVTSCMRNTEAHGLERGAEDTGKRPFGEQGTDLCRAVAKLSRKMDSTPRRNPDNNTGRRLIPLDKICSFGPIGERIRKNVSRR